jgi:hypothetical protein
VSSLAKEMFLESKDNIYSFSQLKFTIVDVNFLAEDGHSESR